MGGGAVRAALRYRFMDPDSAEWREAWALLGSCRINWTLADPFAAKCACCGEVWQYMDTTSDGLHEFRHRHHPVTGRREVVRVLGAAEAGRVPAGGEA